MQHQRTALYTLILASLLLIISFAMTIILVIGLLTLSSKLTPVSAFELQQTIDAAVNDRLTQIAPTPTTPRTPKPTVPATPKPPTTAPKPKTPVKATDDANLQLTADARFNSILTATAAAQ